MVPRPGSTLLEALLALVLFGFGMLALMALTATAARDLAAATSGTRAQSLGRARIERLRTSACNVTADASGVERLPGEMVEVWRVESVGRLRRLSDSVAFPGRGGTRRVHVARGTVLC